MNTQETLQWRYATKIFDTDKHIPEEDLNSILGTANLTATSYGLQPFKFVVVQNQETKDSLVEHSFGQQHVAKNSYLIVLAARTDINADYITEYTKRVEQVREMPAGSMNDFKEAMINGMASKTQEERIVWAQEQTYIVLGTIMVAAAEKKIDGCPMKGFDAEAYDKILGLTEKNLHATVLFPIGYRSESDQTQHDAKVRKPLNDMVVRI